MKILVLLLQAALLLMSIAGVAQPGYQGRKLSLQGSLLVLPALTNASYNREPGLGTYNTTGELSADYVLGRRNSIGLDFRRARTSNLSDYGTNDVSPSKVTTNSIGIHYRMFNEKKGNLAPLGRYFQIGAARVQNQVTGLIDQKYKFSTYALRLGFGRNRILFNRLIIGYGWEGGWVVPTNGEGFWGATYYYEDDATSMAQYRLFRHALFNLKVGLGFLVY